MEEDKNMERVENQGKAFQTVEDLMAPDDNHEDFTPNDILNGGDNPIDATLFCLNHGVNDIEEGVRPSTQIPPKDKSCSCQPLGHFNAHDWSQRKEEPLHMSSLNRKLVAYGNTP